MNSRFIYLMPGGNSQGQSNLPIYMLDSGNSAQFTGDKNDRAYGALIANLPWQTLLVNNPEFVKSQPCAAMQLSNTDMLIFGGEKTSAFTFDTRDVKG